MEGFLHILLAVTAVWLISGTLLNFSKHPHWYIRGWDFPRVFVAGVAGALAVVHAAFFLRHWWDWVLIAGLVMVVIRQLYLIVPYTVLGRKKVLRAENPPAEGTLRLLISNVLMENREHDLWMKVVRGANPDIIVAVEVDDAWDRALQGLCDDYPHCLRQPQDNYYGMAAYSKLPFAEEPELRFLVQDDIPSARLMFRLRDGQRVRIHALHPRPPEPLRNQDSAPRDAELVVLGKEIGEHERDLPTIVCGDLNDVAWSYTSRLFLRLSKLLDPRQGRGQYNSYNAKSRFFRFPLDHVFHSDEFRLIDLRVMPYVGSDHFPILIELSCQPEAGRQAQDEPKERASDQEEAEEIIETQVEREVKGEEEGHLAQGGKNG